MNGYRNRRVLHLISSTDRRGAELAAVRISAALSRRDWDSDVWALAPGQFGGLEVPVLGDRAKDPRTVLALGARARTASVVVAHGSTTLPVTAAATTMQRTPFVYRSIGDPLQWINTPARRRRVRLAANRARMIVAMWRAAAVDWHRALGVPAAKVEVIPNGVPVAEFAPASPAERAASRATLGLDPSAQVALYLGALSPEKRIDLAIDAVSALDQVQLIIVGDGPERSRLAALAAPAGDRIHLVGAVADPKQVLAAANVVVLPSATEGQPSAAIEAVLAGVPVVAANVGGLGEIVQDGRTGRLVAPGDPAALKEAIADVLSHPPGVAGDDRADFAARFDLERVADLWDFLLARITGMVTSGRTGSDTL